MIFLISNLIKIFATNLHSRQNHYTLLVNKISLVMKKFFFGFFFFFYNISFSKSEEKNRNVIYKQKKKKKEKRREELKLFIAWRIKKKKKIFLREKSI